MTGTGSGRQWCGIVLPSARALWNPALTPRCGIMPFTTASSMSCVIHHPHQLYWQTHKRHLRSRVAHLRHPPTGTPLPRHIARLPSLTTVRIPRPILSPNRPTNKPNVFDAASLATSPAIAHTTFNRTAKELSCIAPPDHAIGRSTEQASVTISTPPADASSTHVPIPPTSAPCAVVPPTGPSSAQADPRRVITALLPDEWESVLRELGLWEEFADVPAGLRAGFRIGAAGPVQHTLIHKNHNSALSHPGAVAEHIRTEHAAGRYSGPFDRLSLEALIGPFQTAPLGVVDKASSPGKFRVIQDFSFPRDHSLTSLNSQINPDDFTCTWGFFADVMTAVANAPPGSIAATLDVDAAYRQMPVHILDQPHTVVYWDDAYWVDHCVPFGAASSNGIFGRCGDAMALIYARLGFGLIFKWVDDFLFIQHPTTRFSPSEYSTFGELDAIYAVAQSLGWPWKEVKTRPFAFIFIYLGFEWNLATKFVSIPENKRAKYTSKIRSWIDRGTANLRDTQSVVGTLVHCALAIPEGRPRLAGLIAFAATLPRDDTSKFARRPISKRANADTDWWLHRLTHGPFGSHICPPPPPLQVPIYTDASSSFGIGVIFGTEWAAWRLLQGWKGEGRDIGWAEATAVELAVIWISARGVANASVTIHCDNQGVILAWKAGRSRNHQQNESITRIQALCTTHDIRLDLTYIASAENPADLPSRGMPPPDLSHASEPISPPASILPYIARAHLS